MTTFERAASALEQDCRFMQECAAKSGTVESATYEDETFPAPVQITAFPDGTISLHWNPGMLMRVFARIVAEELEEAVH